MKTPGKRLMALVAAVSATIFLASGQAEKDFRKEREAMVRDQIAARGVRDARVLEAMLRVPRHLFVPDPSRARAYGDHPLPIGRRQTISQPYIVAFMTESLALEPGDKVLEVGTGSGYQSAVLACLTDRVFSVEIDGELARRAAATLQELGYGAVRVREGDGFFGRPEEAPFDAVIVTCAVDRVPPPLIEQLAEGGRLVIPIEKRPLAQTLMLVTKKKGKVAVRELLDVLFVPMTGEAQK
jgi:protein-L-isoaspartate(D-aspartate) O-methyltransferase